jgi:hypothetical protein
MPHFSLIPKRDALLQTIRGRQRQNIEQYRPFIETVLANPEQGGQLEPDPVQQESVQIVRFRLAGAAKTLGVRLHIQRSGNAVYFWVPDEEAPAQLPVTSCLLRAGCY